MKENNENKFDFIIQNPPYSKSLHLDFFNKGLDMLSDTGKMVIIEPATWLIDIRQNIADKKSSQMKKYIAIKERIKGHVSKIIIENYVNDFCINTLVLFSITYIDKSKIFENIEFIRFGEYNKVNSLNDCNLIGNIEIIKSIFKKINNIDKVINHLYIPYIPNKSQIIKENYYCKFTSIIGGINGSIVNVFDTGRNPRKLSQNDFDNVINNYNDFFTLHNNNYYNNAYIVSLFARYKNSISPVPLHKYDRGKHETKFDAECITATKEELENWKNYVFNNSLPLFINICLTIDQHNNSLPYVPWLVDKKYTDIEIYDKFSFTDEEIKLIEITINKYERYSPWFKRYMCGPNSVSNEEVQKFINDLENA